MNKSSSHAVPFTKMQSLGNDFLILDATQAPFDLTPAQIQKIGNRRFGVGFDQLMVLEAPRNNEVDFNYRIFNADGSEVEQCGNGVRCLARFIQQHHLPNQFVLKLGTLNRIVTAHLEGEKVRIEMGAPEWRPEKIPFMAAAHEPVYELSVGHEMFEISVLSMGNPHAVMRVASVDNVDVQSIGRAISTHKNFPDQVNVGFMELIDRSHIRLRVYERGVGETMACGSGACAAVATGCLWGELGELVNVELPGGALQVRWASREGSVELIGSGEFVFTGTLNLPI